MRCCLYLLCFIITALNPLSALADGSYIDVGSFDGIALGKAAQQYINKYHFFPEDIDVCISTDDHAKNEAKRIIECVMKVATCKRESKRTDCPPDNYCISPEAVSVRKFEAQQCEGDAEQIKQINKWAAHLKYAIIPYQVICKNPSIFREVANALLEGDRSALVSQLGYGCRVTEFMEAVKILGKSKDGKLRHVQYQVPFSSDISDGWVSKKSLISEKEFKSSRY